MSTTTQAPVEVATDDSLESLRTRARADFVSWGKLRPASGPGPEGRWRLVSNAIRENLAQAGNARLLKSALTDTGEGLREMRRLPEVSVDSHPRKRILAAAESFLEAVGFEFDAGLLRAYFSAGQEISPCTLPELAALRCALQWVAVERFHVLMTAPVTSAGSGEEAGRLIACLRGIGEAPWRELIEELSVIHRILADDPARAYLAMDSSSRDHYRWQIADMAQRSDWAEEEVATESVRLARKANELCEPGDKIAERRGHAGFYLLDNGRESLEEAIGYRPSLAGALQRIILRYPTTAYLGAVLLATLAVTAFVLSGIPVLGDWWPAALLLVLPASQAAIMIANRLATWLIKPRVLPKLDFSQGIPADCTTLVVVPALLFDAKQAHGLVRDLEIRYAGNRDANLYFALLTDSPDAAQQFDERDDLVGVCAHLIEDLNRRYVRGGHRPFLLFHRHRVYSESERTWMGWERKRGKLLDLNNLLHNRFDSFPVKVGDLNMLPRVRYVITLDADTQLPPDSARRLAGTIAHPLNRAVVDPATSTVVEGYGIVQPRIGISVESATRSYLAAILSGETGFDIYTRATSEVYQDLFGEATFTGKGIYDVATFQTVLVERFPCNALLSHDLIEGAYARAGLASDIELIDDYPTRFNAYCRRKHRWVRGDWQTMFWLLPKIPDFHHHWTRNPISLLSRWKIIDNLRRSLVDVSLFAMLLSGWLWLPGGAFTWTVATLVTLMLPSYFSLLVSVTELPFARDRRSAWLGAADSFQTEQVNLGFTIAFLSHQTLVMLDAVGRTLVRLVGTRRRLLEWETAAEAEMGIRKRTPVDTYLDWTPWLSAAILVILAIFQPGAIAAAFLILFAWAALKPFCRWLDRPVPIPQTILDESGLEYLRGAARQTWQFFRELSTESENWLIPDNIQEEPERIAHRISPTNLGLLLNARLAAWELGFTTLPELIAETEATFRTMRRLERCHGHFLNWYDTRSLDSMPPRFVSTVDSGNLAACLWTVGQAFDEIASRPADETPRELAARLRALASQARRFVDEMDFRSLYNPQRKLLSIGWDIDDGRLDASCYDLLASEARTAHFIALAKGDVPLESWLYLGRTHVLCHGHRALLSWTGTMFEYLMPFLWTRCYPNTVLGRAATGAVRVQQATAAAKRLPWGVSEAACSQKNAEGDYQYGPVGIPALALSPTAGAGERSFLVAPYATFLALPIDAAGALENLRDLKARGCLGRFGYYEAIEFSGNGTEIVRSWMAHHQGMSLVAACNALTGGVMRRYFHNNPSVAATELVLQEKMHLIVNAESA